MQVVLVFCLIFGLAFARFNTVMFRRGLSTDESKGCAELGFLDAVKALSNIQCCALCRQISGCQSVVYDANKMECSICSGAHGFAEVTEINTTSISYYFLDNAEQKENEANRTMRNPIPIDCNHGPWLSKIIDANCRHFQCNFYMFVPSPMRLSDAAKYCRVIQQNKVYILIVLTPEENEFVRRMVFENHPELESIFLGLTFDLETKLRSEEGAVALNYTNWELNFKPVAGQRVTMGRHGKWKLESGTQTRPFVCKI